ncbi:hypothetical protein [Gordonia neofelifaecis]|uniref:Uncharacterized protein n=1 Tax=Gordonia neofelifaecis NRRL B-59395 TaxID=644548 RepID=F1YJV9_9ACTN|nr:hypothetical protein [Gordonia neofelifaecis]EGD55041.1 hypothetical protein SCNU_10946 [Gordonia neofelifaecis NRRL B-59395]
MVLTKVTDLLNAVVARLPESAGKYVVLIFRMIRAIAVNNISDRAMTLAAQAFTSILPVLLLLTTLPGAGIIDRTIDMFRLDGLGLGQPDSPETYASFGFAGAFMTIVSATSMARALDRMYVGVWGVTSTGLRGWWRWVAVVVVLALATIAQALVVLSFDDSDRHLVLALVGTFVVWTLAWTAVPRILTVKQLGKVDLYCLGGLAGTGITVFMVVTEIGYSQVFKSARDSFGPLGVVFASIGWLFVFTAIVVVATVLVQVIRRPEAETPDVVEQEMEL